MPEATKDDTTQESVACTVGWPGRALIAWFLIAIFSVPLIQLGWEIREGKPIQALGVFTLRPALECLQGYERTLEDDSVVSEAVQPYVRWLELVLLHSGTRKTVVGRGQAIFYRPALDSAVGPGFMDTPFGEGHPLPAIIAFRDDLRSMGVQLALLVVPGKQTIYPQWLSGRYSPASPVPTNSDMERFVAELRRAGVLVVDPTAALVRARDHGGLEFLHSGSSAGADALPDSGGGLYLRQDTHWTPSGLSVALDELVRALPAQVHGSQGFEAEPVQITHHGDLYDMLNLPALPTPLGPEKVTVHRVLDGLTRKPVEPDPQSPVVLLGDSFTNIYSLPEMQWGDHGGLSEQLALKLGRTIDVIAQNDGGVNTARSTLARRGASVGDKKLVIWQFAARDLVVSNGDWKRINIARR